MTLIIDVSCTSSKDTKRFVLKDGQTLEVGRSNEHLNLFNDARLSRRHFEIRYSSGKIEIEHLSRTNPTLLASEGSSDFEKVKGTQVESGNCRIIAGSHRFVLVNEKAESVSDPTLSQAGDHSDFWSDVDSKEDSHSSVPLPAKRGSKTVQDHESPVVQSPPPVKPKPVKADIFDDDDEDVGTKEKHSEPTIKESATKIKKPFFPVTDDFFDD